MTNIQAIDLLKGLEQSLDDYCELNDEGKTAFRMAITALELFGNAEQLPSAQPDNQIHLCDSCEYNYPECPCKQNDVIFGNGKGNDNICACNKYKPSAQPEQRWIPCSERLPENGRQVLVYARSVHYALAKYDEMREADGTYKKQWVTFDAWKPFYTIKEVIAWMPLPEPYREEGDE